jgi:hypothetical protein
MSLTEKLGLLSILEGNTQLYDSILSYCRGHEVSLTVVNRSDRNVV